MIFANIIFPAVTVIQYVVIHERMLGYIMPHNPLSAQILRDNYTGGVGVTDYPLDFNYSRVNNNTVFTGYRNVRPANSVDFNTFRINPPAQ